MSSGGYSEASTFDVRVGKIQTYTGARGKTYTVRWAVAGKRHQQTFKTTALADSFRSDLLSAMNRGEPFDTRSGQPTSRLRPDQQYSWYRHMCAYVDMKWPSAAGKTRQGIADALATVTPALLATDRGAPTANTCGPPSINGSARHRGERPVTYRPSWNAACAGWNATPSP